MTNPQTTKPTIYPKPTKATSLAIPSSSTSHPPPPPPPPPPSFELGPSPLEAANSPPSSKPASSKPPSSSSTPKPPPPQTVSDPFPPDYEIILEIDAHVQQIPSPQSIDDGPHQEQHPITRTGALRVIQGPLPPSDTTSSTLAYHAFLSIDDVNIPLSPAATASKFTTGAFYLTLTDFTFTVQPNAKTQPELIDAFDRILRWFCHWQNANDQIIRPQSQSYTQTQPNTHTQTQTQTPTSYPPAGVINADDPQQQQQQPNITAVASNNGKQSSVDKISKMGDVGVNFVERLGNRMNRKINIAIERKRDDVTEKPQTKKNLKLGGKFTDTILSSTRSLVGAGATVASKFTDKVSSKVGGAMSNNRVSKSMADAPEGSVKRSFYDHLMAGGLAFGRIYVAADTQGKMILQTTGQGASEIANLKYGQEAESAAKNITGIAVDTYRISRFPQKLGATSLVKGALKSTFATEQGQGQGQAQQTGKVKLEQGQVKGQGQSQAQQQSATVASGQQHGNSTYMATGNGRSHNNVPAAQFPPAQALSVSQYRDISEQTARN